MKHGSPVIAETSFIPLYELIDESIKSLLPVSLRRHNLIVNEVSGQLKVEADSNIISAVISGIINTVMNYSKNSYIRISGKVYNDVMLIHIRDFNILDSSIRHYELEHLSSLIRKVSGFVDVTSYRLHETTIAFSFINK